MTRKMSSRAKASVGVLACVLMFSGIMYSCAPRANENASSGSSDGATTVQKTTEATPEADEFGVITAESWADIYPLEYNSYLMNATNVPLEYAEVTAESEDTTSKGVDAMSDFASSKSDYLELYPEILTLGAGYGYAKYYTEPAGHTYSLWTVRNNGRIGEKTKITCYACKTPQYNAEYEAAKANGTLDEFLSQPFTEGKYTEGISCASCHENDDPTTLKVTRADWVRSMGDDAATVPMQSQVCGQCHCDYSMSPTTGEPTSPYTGGTDSMTPENALKFYDDNDYADWVYESTGAKMLAVRHAEFEFNYAGEGSVMANMGYTCKDCHMTTATSDEGVEYTNHNWTSPLENEELIKDDCSKCHADLVSEVKEIQKEQDGRTHEIGLRAEKFIKNFEAALEAGTLSEDDIAQLQGIQRSACYYWNLVAAENSEGAHNTKMYTECLDKAEELLDQGDSILGSSSK